MFQFVIQHDDRPFDRETKRLIRKHAYAWGAAKMTAKSSEGGVHNRICYQRETQSCQLGGSATIDRCNPLVVTSIPFAMPLVGLDAIQGTYNIGPTDLSALTSAHIGCISQELLKGDSAKFCQLLTCRRQSFFSHLQQRFGRSAFLDAALECLIGKTHSLLATKTRRTDTFSILRCYSEALKGLQTALGDRNQCIDADVLCAVYVLAFFELLSSSTEDAWHHHITGAAQVMLHRGAERFDTCFEKDLLIAMIGPMVCASFSRNEACFLEEGNWQIAIRNALSDTNPTSDRGRYSISLKLIMAMLPGIAKRATSAVCMGCSFATQRTQHIIDDINILNGRLSSWREAFNDYIRIRQEKTPGFDDRDQELELLGTSFVLEMLFNRFSGAVCPERRFDAEQRALSLATRAVTLAANIPAHNGRASFYLGQKAKFAQATIDSAQSWADDTAAGQIMTPEPFRQWCKAMGRHVPS